MSRDALRPTDGVLVRVQHREEVVSIRRVTADRDLFEVIYSIDGPDGEIPVFKDIDEDLSLLRDRISEWVGPIDPTILTLLRA